MLCLVDPLEQRLILEAEIGSEIDDLASIFRAFREGVEDSRIFTRLASGEKREELGSALPVVQGDRQLETPREIQHPLGEIAFQKARVPATCRLDKEGEGFKLGLATLDRVRATVGAAACGMAARALSEALAHAKSRQQFGRPLADFQLIQEKLARMATELTAARLLVYRAAWEKDKGAPRVTLEAAMAKSYATEAAQRIVDDAVQILGGKGVLADNPVDRLYRSVRALRIYEGTTEIQHLIIAGQLVK